jgi:ABC-type Na+ efflux pump permease subunit
MRKALVVAVREYLAAVRSVKFLLGLMMPPLLMAGGVLLMVVLELVHAPREKRYAVIDRTPGQELALVLEAAARRYNADRPQKPRLERMKQVNSADFVVESVAPAGDRPEEVERQRLALSERVRQGELDGFMEIGPDVSRYFPPAKAGPPRERFTIRVQAKNPTDRAFPDWAENVIIQAVRRKRLEAAGIPPDTTQALLRPFYFDYQGLSERDPRTGAVVQASAISQAAPYAAGFGLMTLMFMMILIGSTPLMQSVVDEKTQRIAEVLLGSVRPFELMMGKLLGMSAASLTVAAVYLGSAYALAGWYGVRAFLSPALLLWFLVFQTLAILMYGSLFIAVGAACTDIKETQSLIWPVAVLACLPMMMMKNVMEEPHGGLVTAASFFPFATPMLMTAREAIPPGVPVWQLLLSAAGVAVTTVGCVYIAGRIFRVGILLQGKGANLRELARWVFRG